jgi:GAF domain-containing protein
MVSREESRQVLEATRLSAARGMALRREAMESLARLPGYDWAGIYRLEGDVLVLDAYVGAATDHVRIPVGAGVCGTAVAQARNQVVPDVRQVPNYLSCSVSTRSEIVVLVWRDGEILGQIDADGHAEGAFDDADEAMLEELAVLLAGRW